MSRIVDTIRHNPSWGELDDTAQLRERFPDREGNPDLGVVSYFHLHDRDMVERVVAGLHRLGVQHLRTAVSWADWHAEGGREWYEWLLPKLAADFRVLPSVLYTPPSLGILPKSSSPPREPSMYADFVEFLLTEYEGLFTHVELWNEPNNYIEWDWTVDPEWKIFAEMIGGAAERAATKFGVVPVLGGMSPLDPNWLDLMFQRGAMEHMGVVGIHGFPGTWEAVWEGWAAHAGRVQEVLDRHESTAEVWITECGFSTWGHDEFRMVRELVDASRAPMPRVYWYSAEDLNPVRETLDGFHADERAYHFGLFRRNGAAKLPARVWAEGGIEAVRDLAAIGTRRRGRFHEPATLITGGSGFIGVNLADRLAREGKPVVILDNLARSGVERNLRWLEATHGDAVTLHVADVRDRFAIRAALDGCDEVFHLAAQVAVTTSLDDPELDFGVNLQGTLNLLEEVRAMPVPPRVLFTSTNKVYGDLEDVALLDLSGRYEPADEAIAGRGIAEDRPLSFCSPYGCSKGGADQYVLDYAKTYGIPATVFRMSCIYGPHQFGTEDQGWVAHFLIRALKGDPISIYGDGKQVRDLLFVEDLVEAMLAATRANGTTGGRAFNIGGGPERSKSLLEILELIESVHGSLPRMTFGDWRIADQRYYVSDTSAFEDATGWKPRVSVEEGVERLYRWLVESSEHSALAGCIAPRIARERSLATGAV
ncbi:MAG TPA: NAD-dependent epimerase/dehydratase family protein [Actinomycetota bacterium]|nr:NAD-dependent epimerase/dehydratase family protein [Actinomycetota bacterium]